LGAVPCTAGVNDGFVLAVLGVLGIVAAGRSLIRLSSTACGEGNPFVGAVVVGFSVVGSVVEGGRGVAGAVVAGGENCARLTSAGPATNNTPNTKRVFFTMRSFLF
jgi:hypothetical protein